MGSGFFMHIRRVIVALALAASLLLWRFLGLDMAGAVWLQAHLGYWSVLAACAWFVWELGRELRGHDWRAWAGEHRAGLLLVLLCGVFLHVQEPHMFKVFYDEPSHVAASLTMHRERQAVVLAGAHFFDGEIHYANAVPVFRMYLFSVLLSLLHDVSGYRVENVYVLNGLLGVLVLGLAYICGTRLGGKRVGMLGVLLLAGLPLLAQVATSGSYDLLNLALLLGLWVATLNFMKQPGEGGLDLMLATGVLLALARYESIVYLLIPVGAALYKWKREGTVRLSVRGMLSPLWVWPCFAANFILLNNETFTLPGYRPEGSGFFGREYMADNASRAVYYLFNFDLDSTGSLLLSAAGCLGLIALWTASWTRGRRAGGPGGEARAFALFFALVTAMYIFVLSHFWGMPTQSSATRFILPFYTVLALAAAWLAGAIFRGRGRLMPVWPLFVAAGWALTISGSSNARASTTAHMVLPQSNAWFLEHVRRHGGGRTLCVESSSVFMLAHGYPSVTTAALNAALPRLPLVLEAGLYDEVLVHQVFWRDLATGELNTGLLEPLDKDADYEIVAERSFAVGQLSRIVRLSPAQRRGNGETLRTRFESKRERIEYYYSLLP